MPIYRVRGPDGTIHKFEGPEGATPQEIEDFAAQQFRAAPAAKQAAPQVEDPGFLKTTGIAAGRTGDKVVQGLKQLGLNALIAGKEATGIGDPKANFQELARMETEQKGRDAAYAPLRELRPFATGMGEAGPSLAIPGGQATAMGRIFAPALGMAGIGAAGYGTAQERGGNALTEGLLGLGGGALAEVGSRLISPLRKGLTSTQLKNLTNAADNVGYTPRASQMTGSQTLANLEDALARSPGGAGVMADFATKNADAVNRRAAQSIGVNLAPDQALTRDVLGSAKETIGKTYDTLRGRATMPVTSDVLDAVSSAEKALQMGAKEGKGTALTELTRLKDELYGTKQFDGATFQTWVSDLKSLARGTENKNVAAQLSKVAKKMEEVGQGADRAAWQTVNKQNAAFETLMKPNVVNDVTGQVNPLSVARSMEQQLGQSFKTGKIDGPLNDVAMLGRSLPPLREGSQTFQRGQADTMAGYALAAPRYLAAKTLTSGAMRDYLARGLLANPEISRQLAMLSRAGLLPGGVAGTELLGPYAASGLLGLMPSNAQR